MRNKERSPCTFTSNDREYDFEMICLFTGFVTRANRTVNSMSISIHFCALISKASCFSINAKKLVLSGKQLVNSTDAATANFYNFKNLGIGRANRYLLKRERGVVSNTPAQEYTVTLILFRLLK